jgi:hypothetical protein
MPDDIAPRVRTVDASLTTGNADVDTIVAAFTDCGDLPLDDRYQRLASMQLALSDILDGSAGRRAGTTQP